MRRAIELGLNLIDTALAYGEGHSERLVGQVVRETGHKIYVATKVPPKNRLWPARPRIGIEEVFPTLFNFLHPFHSANKRERRLERAIWKPR